MKWAEPSLYPAVLSLVGVAAYQASAALPRGWIARDLALAVKPSAVPNGGRGLFTAAETVAAGTCLGAYSGRLRTRYAYHQKLQRVPRAAEYCWQLQSEWVLDPTDEDGILLDSLPAFEGVEGVPLPRWSTTLAMINEPPPGGDVNCRIEESLKDAFVVAERDIGPGEEIFLDYGPLYDRSSYGKKPLK